MIIIASPVVIRTMIIEHCDVSDDHRWWKLLHNSHRGSHQTGCISCGHCHGSIVRVDNNDDNDTNNDDDYRPCELFHNPLLYDKISVEEAIKLDANHVIIIYKRRPDTTVERRLVEGPAVIVPEAEEWLVVELLM